MANVQPENGYTKIANEILERMALTKFSPIQYRIIFVIWRYTYGFNRKEHEMSLNFLHQATNYDKRQLQRELSKLEESKVIIQRVKNGVSRVISFNKNYDEWVGNSTIGNFTNGNSTDGKNIKGTVGKSTKGTIGNSTNQERNKEKYKENYTEQIKNLLSRYSKETRDLITAYWNVVKQTRKSGEIQKSVIFKTMDVWSKFDEIVVKYALKIHVESHGDKSEKYTLGIMRSTTPGQASDRLDMKPYRKKEEPAGRYIPDFDEIDLTAGED